MQEMRKRSGGYRGRGQPRDSLLWRSNECTGAVTAPQRFIRGLREKIGNQRANEIGESIAACIYHRFSSPEP